MKACGLVRRRLLAGTSPPCLRQDDSEASPLSPVLMRSQKGCQPCGASCHHRREDFSYCGAHGHARQEPPALPVSQRGESCPPSQPTGACSDPLASLSVWGPSSEDSREPSVTGAQTPRHVGLARQDEGAQWTGFLRRPVWCSSGQWPGCPCPGPCPHSVRLQCAPQTTWLLASEQVSVLAVSRVSPWLGGIWPGLLGAAMPRPMERKLSSPTPRYQGCH